MKTGWQYVETNGVRDKMAPNTLAVNVLMSENGASLMQGILDKFFPVGSIRLTTSSTNPGNYMGGTWTAWGSGRVPVGINTGDGDFNTVEKTGGAKAHTLTVAQMPAHTHTPSAGFWGDGVGGVWDNNWGLANGKGRYMYASKPTISAGGNQPHNNLQPYITCYMWKRTA